MSWLTTALPAPARGGSSTRASNFARLLPEHPLHPALHDLHLRGAVQVLAGVPAGARGDPSTDSTDPVSPTASASGAVNSPAPA